MKTIWKQDYSWILEDLFEEPSKKVEPEQLELPLEHTLCKHTLVDDGENMRIICTKCGYYREVSFLDTWEGKTYQEIYEILQKDFHLK